MKIGVIGGNGVAATNRLCEMIERKKTAAGAFRDAHHPEMIVWQATSAPSRSMFLEGRGSDWRPDYIRIAKQLKFLGCDLGCMCCNTAHYAIEDIAVESGLVFINILEEVAMRVKDLGVRKIELWVSDGAKKFDIYGPVFKRIAPECQIVYPADERQKQVTKIICAVKTSARLLMDSNPEHPRSMIRALISSSKDPVLLGCTDLRTAYSVAEPLDCGVVCDSLEVLADAILAKSQAANNSGQH